MKPLIIVALLFLPSVVLALGLGKDNVTGLSTPVNDTDAANKKYVDDAVNAVPGDNLGDHAATTNLNMNGMLINNLQNPVDSMDAATRAYVDAEIAKVIALITHPPIPTGKLNDTGIVNCSDNIDSQPCPVATHPGQDAEYGRDATHNDSSDGHAGFSFTKLDTNGAPLLASATSWSCIKDNVTGLIWEVKTDDGGLHDKDDRHNWYNTDSATNGGDPGTADEWGNICYGYDSGNPASYCNTQAYVARVNQAGWCGRSDWRIPTKEALGSLLDYSVPSPGPTIDTDYFPHVVGLYAWSSSPHALFSNEVWVISFLNGGSGSNGKNAPSYARLVRGGQ